MAGETPKAPRFYEVDCSRQSKRYLLPTLETVDIAKLTLASVRAWRSSVLSEYSGDAVAKG